MPDPSLDGFKARIARIERDHRKGRGFEAAGALGRADFRRRGRRGGFGGTMLRTGVFVLAVAFGSKAVLFYHLGPEAYGLRLARLEAEGGLFAAQAALMAPDAITRAMAGGIAALVAQF